MNVEGSFACRINTEERQRQGPLMAHLPSLLANRPNGDPHVSRMELYAQAATYVGTRPYGA
jgi:hypothetical protein